MSLECKCDECNKYIDVDNSIYCKGCYEDLVSQIKALEAEVEALRKE